MNRTIYLNGQFLPESEARLSAYDLGVMQAAAVFEMTRSFGGRHFKLREHIIRLLDSCAAVGIPPPMTSVEWWEDRCNEVSDRNDHGSGEEHRLLITVSPGPAPMYREIAGDGPTVFISDFPLRYTTAGLGRQFTEGGTAIISSIQQVPDACVPSSAKHRSRLHFHLAQEEAKRKGADWAILTQEIRDESYIAECPGANIFFLSHGTLYTPESGCLRGISRAYVIALARSQGVEVVETDIGTDHIPERSEEVFVTGTPFCMLPIVKIGNRMIGDGTPGPVYKKLLDAWSNSVGVGIAEQIQAWDAAAGCH